MAFYIEEFEKFVTITCPDCRSSRTYYKEDYKGGTVEYCRTCGAGASLPMLKDLDNDDL